MSDTEQQLAIAELPPAREGGPPSRDFLPRVDFDGGPEQLDQYAAAALKLVARATGVAVDKPETHFDFSEQVMPYGIPLIAEGEGGWTMEGYYDTSPRGGDEIRVVLRQREQYKEGRQNPPRLLKKIEVTQRRVTQGDPSEGATSSVSCFVREYDDSEDKAGNDTVGVYVQESAVGGRDAKLVSNSVLVDYGGEKTGKRMLHKLADAARTVLIRAGIHDRNDRPPYSSEDMALRWLAKLTANEKLRRRVYEQSGKVANELANDVLGEMIDGLPQFTVTEEHRASVKYQQGTDN